MGVAVVQTERTRFLHSCIAAALSLSSSRRMYKTVIGCASMYVVISYFGFSMAALALIVVAQCARKQAESVSSVSSHQALILANALYMFLLAMGTFSDPSTVSRIIQNMDPYHTGFPEEIDRRTDDCSFTRDNVMRTLDIYVVAHVVGFAVKAAMLQDRRVVWVSAVIFEFAEFLLGTKFSAVVPNLAECAWDRLILDLAMSNFVGMEIGFAVTGQYRRSFLRWNHVMLLAALASYADISAFLLKSALHLRTESPLHVIRLLVLATLGFPAVDQYYRWCRGKPGGAHLFALLMTLCFEAVFTFEQIRKRMNQL